MSSYAERIRKSEKYHTFDDIAQMQVEITTTRGATTKNNKNTHTQPPPTTTAATTLPTDFSMKFSKRNKKKRARKNENNHFEFSVGVLVVALL